MPILQLLPWGRAPRTPSSTSAAISKEADRYYNNLIIHGKERLIPWSKSPFYDQSTIAYRKLQEVQKQTNYDGVTSPEACVNGLMADEAKDLDHDESNNKETGEHPPVWLDLFYDLAWTSTFSNVTQNNTISGEESLPYAAFFVLVWWMWVSQVSYNIRFYSNDWVHRICIFFQFCVFAALAAFTSGLDVMEFIRSGNSGPAQRALDIINGVSQDQRMARDRAEKHRVLLCLQYIRVWLYAHDKRDPAVTIKPIAMFISTGLWCSSIAMLLTQYTNDATQVANFVIWGIAVAIEVASHYFSPLASHLRSTRSLAPRLATLVTIISGEGLIVIIGTLWLGPPSPGFILRALCAALVAYLTFYLYFESTSRRVRANRPSLWIFLHLPYMICIVLFMEGIKNLLLYTILCQSTEFVITQVLSFLEAAKASDNTFSTLNQTMDTFLTEIGMPWDDQKKLRVLVATAMNNTATNQAAFERAFTGGLYRLFVDWDAQAIEVGLLKRL
ncbi:Cytochrome bd-II ubiquinol oxidase subunit 2 [Rhizoctonia solani]|uniref:Cytochrome bd-II ubiquinol oxidase subunit 2 n=1 Tax=Rhizoctonia solani TaxID=456999 RepID=A0A0K6FZB9_9AGAM|nr:Cytochrome bd-II ubiquinol oxidase subunit 2 [Rhizoctonia solani]